MSKVKVKFFIDNTTRTLEFDRENFKFDNVKEQIAGKTGLGQFGIQCNNFILANEQQFQKAVKDAEKAGAKNLEVKILKGYTPSATYAASAPTTTSTPTPTYTAPAAQAPASSYTPQPHAPVAAPASNRAPYPLGANGQIVAYTLKADPNTSADKISINPTQQADSFLFSAIPSKYDTDIIVLLEPGKLTYQTTHVYEIKQSGETVIQTIRGSHGFGLPFNPRPDQIEVIDESSGPVIKLYFR